MRFTSHHSRSRPAATARARHAAGALFALTLAASTAACSAAALTGAAPGSPDVAEADPAADASADAQTVAEAMAENHDYWTAAETGDTPEEITLEGDSAVSTSPAVGAEGSTVTITAGGTYSVSGTLTGQLIVDAGEEQVVLILDGATITNPDSAAILVSAAEGVQLVLAKGTENSVSDADSYPADAAVDAAIFADADLEITGPGALAVSGNGADGIASKKDLVLTGGRITVTAAEHGLRGKDALVVTSGEITASSGGDALRANNDTDADRGYILLTGGSLDLTAGQDAADAKSDLLISGATITATSGGGAGAPIPEDTSTKGLKGRSLVIVEGGNITVDAADDSVHSDGSIYLLGGALTLESGDDGVHADHTLEVAGASVRIIESEEGLEATWLTISDGEVNITSADDGLNATNGTEDSPESTGEAPAEEQPPQGAPAPEGAPEAGPAGGPPNEGGPGGGMDADDGSELVISGGTVVIDAEGDGIDSNGSLTIAGGEVTVFGTQTGGDGAFDANGDFTIEGGTVIALSAGQMEEVPAGEGQAWFAAAAAGGQGTAVEFTAGQEELASITAVKGFGWAFYSGPWVTEGSTYSVSADGNASSAVAGETTGTPGRGERPAQVGTN